MKQVKNKGRFISYIILFTLFTHGFCFNDLRRVMYYLHVLQSKTEPSNGLYQNNQHKYNVWSGRLQCYFCVCCEKVYLHVHIQYVFVCKGALSDAVPWAHGHDNP